MDRLLAEGNSVEVVDNFSTGSLSNLSQARLDYPHQVRIADIDIRSEEFPLHIARSEPEVIFHMAAQADVRVSIERPVFDAGINILGTVNLLEGARIAKVRKIVYAASGGTLYGDVANEKLPISESEPQRPLSQYGVSKKVALDYFGAYKALYGIEFSALALANVYGPRQDPHGEAGVVAIFAGNLIKKTPCIIFGDGSQTRDFVFVDDVVDAFSKAATLGDGEVINIGTGVETSVNQLYEAICKVCNLTTPATYQPARQGELERSCLNPRKAKKYLNWKSWTTIGEGVSQVVNHLALSK